MPTINFPLRWESTGEQWWYASPIDFAAANGHYDLVRELIRIDNNHLFKLTSLRRIRRLETVWDDEEQFHDVAKCRSAVARKLFLECESKKGKNSLIGAGYGGWLMYTAASAGDLAFVQELLHRDPLIVFGEGEYGVTDILYAAARSKDSMVFRLVFDFAVSPRFTGGHGHEMEQQTGEIPSAYKSEMLKRAAHAAARGGNLEILKEILGNSSDILAYRDIHGSTILHTAAGRGQVEVVRDLIASYDIVNCADNQGNTALHVAAYRGQLPVVEALILAASSTISLRNNAGETFLHMAISGFQTPTFGRLDRQIGLMKQLICGKIFNIEEMINAINNDGRTALHMAIVRNIHSDLVQLLMTIPSINVNIRDVNAMTPLDLLRQQPHSASSDILAIRLTAAGGILSYQDNNARKVIASCLRIQGSGGSPGTSFRISDAEIFSHTGIKSTSISDADPASNIVCSTIGEHSPLTSTEVNDGTVAGNKKVGTINYATYRLSDAEIFSHTGIKSTSIPDADPASNIGCSTIGEHSPVTSTEVNDGTVAGNKKVRTINYATYRLKNMFHWPGRKEKQHARSKQPAENEASGESYMKPSISQYTPVPLRQRFSKPSSLSNNKRTLSARSDISSPLNRKKLASGVMHGVIQDMPHLVASSQSPPSPLSKISFSSSTTIDKQKSICIENDDKRASSSCSNHVSDDETSKISGSQQKSNKRLRFCFGAPAKRTISRQWEKQSPSLSIASKA